ncbi:hypothetical protein [Niabella hibiscisoli]|uniref:hypothetical protein n=1 Tax=Niabella hibiscisoli TaxID=1825928 RepID=UPI001F1029CD|nr:hypothetical protein [Niabella hibiscisoli]MCH5719630.1 hypothetical protein [Niabella hibiscisoli]
MANKFSLIICLILFQLALKAQTAGKVASSDSLSFAVAALVSPLKLKHSYLGEAYFLIAELKDKQIKTACLLNAGSASDTIVFERKDVEKLVPYLYAMGNGKETSFIMPIVYIEDPKRGPNGNVLLYDVTLHKIFAQLYKITRELNGAIVLPLEMGIKVNITAY